MAWDGAKDFTFSGKPSPDGRYLSYVDWDSGNLGIHDFTSNQDRLLTNVGWPQQAWNSVFSPNGQRIAYAWLAEGTSSELRVIGIDESEPRTLYKEGDWITPTAWSPNGKTVYYEIRDDANVWKLVRRDLGSGLDTER